MRLELDYYLSQGESCVQELVNYDQYKIIYSSTRAVLRTRTPFLIWLGFFALLFFFWLFDLAGALEVLEFGD